MRILTVLALTYLIFSCSGKKYPSDCARFKYGKYYFHLKGQGTRVELTRDTTFQEEYNPITDTITTYSLKWKSECEYEVFKLDARKKNIVVTSKDIVDTSSQSKTFLEIVDVVVVKFRIIATSDNYYVFKTWKQGSHFTYNDTMWVAK